MHKQCFTFKNLLNLRHLFFVMYLIFPKIKVMIIFKHLFVISIPSKTLATSSQYVRKLAIFALLIEGQGITMTTHFISLELGYFVDKLSRVHKIGMDLINEMW